MMRRSNWRSIAVCALLISVGMDHVIAVSLYKEELFQPLASDRRASRRGDLVTVMVVENSSASSTANTVAGRDASVGFDLAAPSRNIAGGIKFNNDLNGRGLTQREGKVLAQITVKVLDVTESGDLIIGGEQFLEVNNERQQIRVEGRIRPQDVTDTNTVLSTRIADAKISYAGKGELSDRQRAGWWQRLLTWFGL